VIPPRTAKGGRDAHPGHPSAPRQDPQRREGRLDKVLTFEEIRNLITAMGAAWATT